MTPALQDQAPLEDRSASYTKKLFPQNPLKVIGPSGHDGLLRHYIPLWEIFTISDTGEGRSMVVDYSVYRSLYLNLS